MQNIEVKSPLHDPEKTEIRLCALGARKMWTRRQVDTFFRVPSESGWLKLRESEGRPAELISYERSTGYAGPRPSNYDIVIVKDPPTWKRLLGRVVPVEIVVEKERTLWIYEHTRIHLDRVQDLGQFIELETVVDERSFEEARAETERVVEALALDAAEVLAVPYKDLIGER